MIFLELHGKDKVNLTKKFKMAASICILQTRNEIASKGGKNHFFFNFACKMASITFRSLLMTWENLYKCLKFGI